MLEKIIISLLIGVIIGLEREHWRVEKKIYAGVRTFAITCVTGAIVTILIDYTSIWLLVITTMLIAFLSASIVYSANLVKGKSGLTTAISLFFTYLIGIIVAYGFYLVGIITALIITFLLIEKKPLHSFAEKLSEGDISSALKFIAVAFVLYPIVPDEPIFGIISLKYAIMIVVLVSFISFVSYIAMKKIGPQGGIPYSGFFGGFVSSVATIVALSEISRKRPVLKDSAYIGVMLAVVSMIISNLVIALVVDTSARTVSIMMPPLFIMGIVAMAFVIKKRKSILNLQESIDIGSPFALGPAFKFGAIFTIFLIVANYANEYAGSEGTYVAAIGGIISSSAVTASVAALAFTGSVSFHVAAETAVLAGIISTLSKIIYIRISGSRELFKTALLPFTIILISGIFALAIWSFYIRSYMV